MTLRVKKIGWGAYGAVYVFSSSDAEALRAMLNVDIFVRDVPKGSRVVVKEFYDLAHEDQGFSRSQAHADADAYSCPRAQKYFPRMYWSGLDPQRTRFTAMEYVEGVTLRDFVLSGACCSVDMARKLEAAVRKALHVWATCGLAHRDLHANNVMVAYDRRTRTFDITFVDLDTTKIGPRDDAFETILGTRVYAPHKNTNFQKLQKHIENVLAARRRRRRRV